MDWDEVTRGWVAEGLIHEAQRDPLRAWLEAHATTNPFGDVVLATLVSAGCWLLTGSLALSIDLAGFEGDSPVVACLIAGLLQAALGVAARFSLGRPVAQGLWTAAVPILTFSVMVLQDGPWQGAELVWLVPTLLPAVIGTAGAVFDRMPGLAAASAFAAIVPLAGEAFELRDPFAAGIAAVSLAVTGVYALGALLKREQTAPLQAQVPFLTVLGILGIATQRDPWESGSLLALYGALVLGAAAVGRSRWTLVSGVVALVAAEIVLLGAVSDMLIATVVLGLEGLALMVGAFVYLGMKAGKRRRRSATQDVHGP